MHHINKTATGILPEAVVYNSLI